MKQFLTLAALFVMTFTAVAQPPMGQGPKGREFPQDGPKFERQDPAEVAQKQTDQLDKLVTLTPKQYKKIYKFNKRQAERVKKYRKILTPEQFQKWESFEAQREFRQMIENPKK